MWSHRTLAGRAGGSAGAKATSVAGSTLTNHIAKYFRIHHECNRNLRPAEDSAAGKLLHMLELTSSTCPSQHACQPPLSHVHTCCPLASMHLATCLQAHWLDWDKRPRPTATDFFRHATRNSSCTCAIARSGRVSMKLTRQPSPEILKAGEHRKSSPKLDMSSMPVTASSSQRLA